MRLLNYYQTKRGYKKENDITYISSFATVSKDNNWNDKSDDIIRIHNSLKNYEKKIFRILNILKDKHNFKIKVLMKQDVNSEDFEKEKEYLKLFFKAHEILIKKNNVDGYKFIEKSKITISILSALGLEALSLNTKVLLGFPLIKLRREVNFWDLRSYAKYLKSEISLKHISKEILYSKIQRLNKLEYQEYVNLIKVSRKHYSRIPNLKRFNRIIYEN